MMMSPESFIAQYENAPYSELVKAHENLVSEYKEVEGELANPGDNVIHIDPSPEVRHAYILEYLGDLTCLMHARAPQ